MASATEPWTSWSPPAGHVAARGVGVTSTVLELYDPADDEPHGAAIVGTVDEATYELRAWASTSTRPPLRHGNGW